MASRARLALALVLCGAIAAAEVGLAQDTAGQPDDHYMCYSAKRTSVSVCAAGEPNEGSACEADADCGGAGGACVSNRFDPTGAELQDGFDTGGAVDYDLIKPVHLCAPADKEAEGVEDADTHLVAYKIKVDKNEPKPARHDHLMVMNQFGLVSMSTRRPDRLLVPAAKGLTDPVAAPDNNSHAVDHYKCYKARTTPGTAKFTEITSVGITDQFAAGLYDLVKPTRLCRPVDKNGEGIKNPAGHLVCYRPSPAGSLPPHLRRRDVYVNDQFGPAIVNTIKPQEFCVPSAVLEAPAPGCEPLNGNECLLPYPSTAYMIDDPTTDTGVRVNVPAAGLPQLNGPPPDAALYNQRDGFSPTAQILMHFPQGVDAVQSGASRLLPAGCCSQPPGPPWIDTRTHDARSLDFDSPSLLFDADTGEQILHFIENDAHAEGNASRQALVLRPGLSLKPNRRYIVAMRDLKTAGGGDVLPEAAFLVLRDGIPTNVPAIEARRQHYEANIFAPLASFGVPRSELVLAFDFITASDHQLTHQILSMRDQAYAWLATVEASPMAVPFTVDSVLENDCMVAGQTLWRRVKGTFESPLFLDDDLLDNGPQFMNVDGDDVPVQNGFTNANFSIAIPCKVLDPMAGVTRPAVIGHGLFQTGEVIESLITPVLAQFAPDVNLIGAATDWRGLSGFDLAWIGAHVIGIGSSKLNNFEALPDRLSQGMLNTLVMARMMKLGIFNRDTAFQKPGGAGVFPGPSEEMFYYGISLGGIMGTWFSALTPDVIRFGLDVPGMNFSCLLQRSTNFNAFEALLDTIGLTDPLETILGINLLHDIWVAAEPAGFVHHVTTDRLPGSGTTPVRILMTPAWLDKQVSNTCTEMLARSLGIPNLVPASVVAGMPGIPDLPGPLDSAYVMWDGGSFDLFDPAHEPFIPPLTNEIPSNKCDPHPVRPTIPASIDQLLDFLQPGGVIENTCTGLCDGDNSSEIPLGAGAPCNPLN